MKKIIFKIFIAPVLVVLMLSGCTSLKRTDDVVRIKADSAQKYMNHPGTGTLRDGRTLHGTVLRVMISATPDSCPITAKTRMTADTSVLFLDDGAEDIVANYEIIPISSIESIRDIFPMPGDKYNNVNFFESLNNPNRMRGLRQVPIDYRINDTCDVCSCRQWDPNFSLNIHCVKRTYPWYFLELRGTYAAYTDMLTTNQSVGRDTYGAEAAGGFRFGGAKEWGLGVAITTGINAYNSYSSLNALRWAALLHLRYQASSDKFFGLCMKPFVYGQFGMTIDNLSVRLFKFHFSTTCEECKKFLTTSGQFPEINVDLPLSYGLGFGLDIPVTPWNDISFDIGYRSYGFGESAAVGGFVNVPTLRRINILIFRFGLTI